MDYYINEYSLRGQFAFVEDFFQSLREYTLPVFDKIQENKENLIWKKDVFWQCKICKDYSLAELFKTQRRNERSAELSALRIKLLKIVTDEPYWGEDELLQTEITEYQFDKMFCENFERINCFYKAIQNEGKIVSFLHQEYIQPKLSMTVKINEVDTQIDIDNIYALSWWEKEPEIKTWKLKQKYTIEIRANEFSYHPPHFHVSHNEFSAVFRLYDGILYREGKNKWPPYMLKEIAAWYSLHREELMEAWKSLHRNSPF